MNKRSKRIPSISSALAALSVAGLTAMGLPTRTLAHPHIFALAHLNILIDDGQTVTALEHHWIFDEFFSSTVIMEFGKNGSTKLDEAELKTVSETVHKSLADFNYFQSIVSDGTELTFAAPEHMTARFDDELLVLEFTTKAITPVKIGHLMTVGVFDPTLYTAIEFAKDRDIVTTGLSASCTRKVIRPDPDDIIELNQDSLTDEFYEQTSDFDMSRLAATRIEIECQP